MRAVLPQARAHLVRLEEADRDPRGDAEHAGHHRHRRGELLAVAASPVGTRAEERDEVVGPGAGGDVRAVDEPPVLAEPLLQRHRLLEPGRRLPGDVVGEGAHHGGDAGRQPGVVRAHRGRRAAGVDEVGGRELQLDAGHRVPHTAGVEPVAAGDEVHRRRVVAPVPRRRDPGDRRLRRQPGRGERVRHGHVVVVGPARHGRRTRPGAEACVRSAGCRRARRGHRRSTRSSRSA